MTEPFKPAISPDHAAHDATWMAALAARDHDLDPSELARAQAALESCGTCADLFADLAAISAAVASAAIPSRPRDYTLTPADAARLRSRSFRRWYAAIGSARDGITFPLAMGLTTLGIAGLLLATLPGALMSGMGGAASAPEARSNVGGAAGPSVAASAAPAQAASAAPVSSAAASAVAAAAPSGGVPEDTDVYGSAASPTEETPGGEVFTGADDGANASGQRQDGRDLTSEFSIGEDGNGFSTLAVVAGLLLILGLALFALRWSSRRL